MVWGARSRLQVQNLSPARSPIVRRISSAATGYVLATAPVLGMMLGFSTAPDDDQSGNPSSMAAQSHSPATRSCYEPED
jgi:hypothetical protein